MNEIEIGAKVDIEKIEEKLISLGAICHGEEKQVDNFFGLSHRGLVGDEVVRLREKKKGAEITYKKPSEKNEGVVSRREISFKTSVEEGKIFLEALGVLPLVVVDKTRKIYKLKDFNIGLDRVSELGEFIEIELICMNKEIARKRIINLMETLEISENSLMTKPYFLMLSENQKPKSKRNQKNDF